MALICNIRRLEEKNLHLKGELPSADLELEAIDEMIHVNSPVTYDLEAQQFDQSVLVQGSFALTLDCECVRCLKPFKMPLKLDHWACHLALEGEEKAVVVNDCVDLTPYIREDIVLAFPQHPLCKPECSGLASIQQQPEKRPGVADKSEAASSTWAALDKLKL
jgi:uncharacterized protein